MKRASETRANPRSLAALVVTLAVLAGCEEGLSPEGASEEAPSDDTQTDDKVELFPDFSNASGASVEAPDVFNVVEAGLWDGRPSLGGIWVAHPDVTQPERVVIKNTSNNKSITGALFRRERSQPGPALQLSSAAAEKLGILAGAPTKVEVIALRRKPVEEKEPEPEETPEIEAAENTPAAEDSKSQDDAVDTAAAETEKPAKRKWWQKKETVAAAGATGAAAAAATETAAEATTEAAEQVVEAAAEATPTPTLSDPEITAPTEKPAKRKWWQKKKSDTITETPLDPIAGAAAAIDAAEPTPVAATAAATSQQKATRSLPKPYVQVGTFNVEANAQSAVSKIERNGMSADIRELKTDDKTVWRVLVGPANTRAERNAIQRDVKDLGFTDAFTVKN
ncbi:SPOR domain-containing protein [Ruegeria arenilitoris]|uniref:SPOR domain-containing protein n=1 Tax=Ruegeria arenilitoris TaxID=1173585 RepID=UPI00147B3E1E|nr:SPOR domain-containing protein [Ruegeria arenilitoris]